MSPATTANNSGAGGFELVPNQAALIAQAVATVKSDGIANANLLSAAPPSLARAPIANRLFATEETGEALINSTAAYAAYVAAHETITGTNRTAWVTAIPGSFELLGNTPAVYVAVCNASAQIVRNAQEVPLPGFPGEQGDDGELDLMEHVGTWKLAKALNGPNYPFSTGTGACAGWFGQAQQDVLEGKL
ncbi:MAG: hypothetical protein ACRDY2_08180 [Acidimicrobiales bacterium]